MTKQTAHSRDQREGEVHAEVELKVPENLTDTAAIEQLTKAAKKLAKRHERS